MGIRIENSVAVLAKQRGPTEKGSDRVQTRQFRPAVLVARATPAEARANVGALRMKMASCWSFPMTCLPLSGFNEQALTAVNLGLYLINILTKVREL